MQRAEVLALGLAVVRQLGLLQRVVGYHGYGV